jgi:hypothetical protein
MPDDLMDSLEPFDISESDTFKTDYLSGYVADMYDVPQDCVMPHIRKRIANSVEEAFKKTVTGYDHVMLNSSEIETADSDSDYVLYPVWLFNLAWNGERYTFAMNGQTGKVAGNIPVDKLKLNLFIVLLFVFLEAGAWLTFSAELKGEDLISFMSFALIFWAAVCVALRQHFITQLQSVELKQDSDEYYREGSMNIAGEDEKFLYTKIEFVDD